MLGGAEPGTEVTRDTEARGEGSQGRSPQLKPPPTLRSPRGARWASTDALPLLQRRALGCLLRTADHPSTRLIRCPPAIAAGRGRAPLPTETVGASRKTPLQNTVTPRASRTARPGPNHPPLLLPHPLVFNLPVGHEHLPSEASLTQTLLTPQQTPLGLWIFPARSLMSSPLDGKCLKEPGTMLIHLPAPS